MTQKKFKRLRYFHFTTRFVHPKWFEMTLYRNWMDLLRALQSVQNDRIDSALTWHSAVIMSNHIHLLFSTDSYDEHSLVLDLEEALKKELGIKRPLFQRPLPCEPLEHWEYLKSAYVYIYRNPVEVGLVRRAQDYPYSSLHLLLALSQPLLQHPFIDPFNLVQDLPRKLKWINSPVKIDANQATFFHDHGPGF